MTRVVTAASHLRASGRKAFAVMRRRDWLLVAAACAGVLLLFATLLVAQLDAYRARSQAAMQAQAQASIVADQRAAQSRRIDSLSRELARTRAQVSTQARLIGRQEQAIRDLAAQVDQLGGDPVASRVSTARTTTPRTTPSTRPTTAPTTSSTTSPKPRAAKKPTPRTTTPSPTPQPQPSKRDGPLGICVLLPLC